MRVRVFAAAMICALSALAFGGVRPPAVPLVTQDPYMSCWSTSDRLYDSWPRHWTGSVHALCGIVRVDGKAMRFMGGDNATSDTVQQTSLEVRATQTLYRFAAGPVDLSLRFTSPLLVDDLEVLSRPASYITFSAESRDGASHEVEVYLDASAEWTVNEPGQAVTWSRLKASGMDLLRMGTVEQPVLKHAADDARIDWGYLLLGVNNSQGAATAMGSADDIRQLFSQSGKIPAQDDQSTSRAANDRWPVLAAAFPLGKVSKAPVTRHVVLAYDDIYSIEYFHQPLRAWWRRSPQASSEQMVAAAEADYARLLERCDRFDSELVKEATAAGGAKYAELCALVWRQTLAAHKPVAAPDGTLFYISKENSSAGCVNTVDVTFPTAPFFLRYNTTLLKGQLTPVFDYARGGEWKYAFAPHDLGTYPKANGQTYGLTLERQMPVEESGNMLIMTAALCRAEGKADYAKANWDMLNQWADYLVSDGLDPQNQLCTADMFGRMPHNADLSLKAIIAIGGYAQLCSMMGKTEDATSYSAVARRYAERWQEMAKDDAHTRLAFDKPGSWGMKHNLVWDRVLGLKLFPESLGDMEVAWYKKVQGKYGLACDNRTPTTLMDWAVWCISLARTPEDFQALFTPLYNYANETPSRVPLSDWFNTETGERRSFQARSVLGGIYMPMLLKHGCTGAVAGVNAGAGADADAGGR